ncbi:aminotransferase class IV [bacterium]|nr:aminotransferase class IV [bacterium]
MICYHNGNYIDEDTIKLGVSSPAFQYGYGIFTSLRTKDGQAKLLSKHLERLESSSSLIGIDYPEINFGEIIEKLVKLNDNPNLRIKIIIHEESYQQSGVLVLASQLNLYPKPIKLTLISKNYEANSLRKIKSLNYLENVYLHRRALNEGFDEGLLVNSQNLICECCYANIFFIKEGRIHTPKADNNNILNGIIRQEIIKQNTVIERDIFLDELPSFEDAFITNSVQGIVYIEQIDELKYSSELDPPRQKVHFLY